MVNITLIQVAMANGTLEIVIPKTQDPTTVGTETPLVVLTTECLIFPMEQDQVALVTRLFPVAVVIVVAMGRLLVKTAEH